MIQSGPGNIIEGARGLYTDLDLQHDDAEPFEDNFRSYCLLAISREHRFDPSLCFSTVQEIDEFFGSDNDEGEGIQRATDTTFIDDGLNTRNSGNHFEGRDISSSSVSPLSFLPTHSSISPNEDNI